MIEFGSSSNLGFDSFDFGMAPLDLLNLSSVFDILRTISSSLAEPKTGPSKVLGFLKAAALNEALSAREIER